MDKKHEIKAAFYKGLEAFLLDCKEIKALIKVISGYINALNEIIGEILDKLKFDEDDIVSVNYTCSDNNDFILITVHNGCESITLATIKRDNTGAFKEFRHIGGTDSITVNNAEDIEKALLRMLEEPALISTLYRLICQSGIRVFNNLNGDDKCEIMIIEASKAIKCLEAEPSIEAFLNYLFNPYKYQTGTKKYQFSIEQSDDAPDEFLLVIQNPRKETLIKFKTQNGTYPVTLKCGEYTSIANDKDMLRNTIVGVMHMKILPYLYELMDELKSEL